jgi:hypothetical protein
MKRRDGAGSCRLCSVFRTTAGFTLQGVLPQIGFAKGFTLTKKVALQDDDSALSTSPSGIVQYCAFPSLQAISGR